MRTSKGCGATATKVIIHYAHTASILHKYNKDKLRNGDICKAKKGTGLKCGDKLTNEYYCDECLMKVIW